MTKLGAAALIAMCAWACASSPFVSTWTSPTARPMKANGAKVAAMVVMGDVLSRRNGEDKLASELTARGAKGIPMYSLMDTADYSDDAAVRQALKDADVQGVVVIRPLQSQTTNAPDYNSAPYAAPWIDVSGVPYESVVSVETLIYSLTQGQLVWVGRSKVVNRGSVADLVQRVAEDTAEELKRMALLRE